MKEKVEVEKGILGERDGWWYQAGWKGQAAEDPGEGEARK
jgi:hypothetical protein